MPSRIIRDGHLDSERVDALSEQAENFYSRLRLVVDDYGRFEADCVILLARTYPRRVNRYTPEQIEGWLQECAQGDEPLVTIYKSGRKRYLQVNDFRQRQRTESKYPAPLTTQMATLTDKCQTAAGLTRASPPHTTTHTHSEERGAGENQESASVIQEAFPGTDEQMVSRIIEAALEAKPDADDGVIAAALTRTRKRNQDSAGLWLHTLPPYLRSARASPIRRTPCWNCGGNGCPDCSEPLKLPPGSTQLELVSRAKKEATHA